MSDYGYPNANYSSAPEYPSDVGTGCGNPKPAWYWEGGTFCGNVTINQNLSVLQNIETTTLTIEGTPYTPTLFLNSFDGMFYKVLASAPYPSDFVPPN